MTDSATREFILAHEKDDTSKLLFAAASYPEVDMKQAVRIIEARRKAVVKLPLWYSHPDIDYPSSLSLEQCSSQQTALYKQRFVEKGAVVADITGGFGVDSFFLSRKASKLYYFERQEQLCEAAEHNFQVLGATNVEVHCSQSIDESRHYDLIYADPARRGKASQRVYSITDCEPDISAILPSLFRLAPKVLVKLSPMADISRMSEEFPQCTEIHVVSAEGEVKEVLLLIEAEAGAGEPLIFADGLKFTLSQEKETALSLAPEIGKYIYVPSKALLKAGAFKLISQKFALGKLDVSTHLYTGNDYIKDFPGRCYDVDSVRQWNNATAQEIKKDYKAVELTAVNFPLDTASLRKKLKVADGGKNHIFATTLHCLKTDKSKGLTMIETHIHTESYNDKLAWLFSQIPSYQKVGKIAYKPGIESMEAFDKALGHPHRAFPSIHIAGTNGKGSTSHMLASGLSACGLKVGLYTSPHLKDFRERARIVENGSYRLISEREVEQFLDKWKDFFVKEKPSFFEITTGLAFDFFAREKVDIAVIETGLGGRLDSTNIITPILSIITNIGLEHCEHLGYTLEEVASQKAGIIKAGVPVVVGEFLPQTKAVFEEKALSLDSPIVFAKEAEPFLTGLRLEDMDLKGDYQQRNIVTLSASAAALNSIMPFDVSCFEEGVRLAAQISGLRGRWETLRDADESRGKARIICDTGHNAHGFRWVREQIDRICCDYDNIFFIFGVVADKDIDAISQYLPRDVKYIFTQASTQRALPAVELANIMHDHGINGRVAPSVKEAMALADSLSGAKDMIFIGGSNFIVSEAL